MQDTPTTRKRGPAPFAPTKGQRQDVALYMASGMSEPRVAAVLGICQNTLRKHFVAELSAGRDRELAANLKRLRAAAKKGNVTAMKHLDGKFSAVSAEASFMAPERHPAKLGKKDEAAAAAETAGQGSEWGADLMTPGSRPN